MSNTEPKIIAHKWEDAVGPAPYQVVALITTPSASLAGQNPSAYNNVMASAHEQARRFGVMLCTCQVCGMGLCDNYVLRNARGGYFVVGCDCVRKNGDSYLTTRTRKVKAAQRKAKAQAEREAKWKADQEARALRAAQERLENGGKTLAEIEADKARAAEREARASFRAKYAYVLEALEANPSSGFCYEIAQGLSQGSIPSQRGLEITAEIVAKYHGGRRGSKAYNEAYEDAYALLTGQE